MKHKLPRCVHGYKDRHGKPRYYLRIRGMKQVRLPGVPWTPEFMSAYEAAVRQSETQRTDVGANRTHPKSINALIIAYYNSRKFQRLSSSTKRTYRGILERFRDEHGDRSAAGLTSQKVEALLDKKATTPEAARNLLRMLRMICKAGVRKGLLDNDPTRDVDFEFKPTGGHHTWTEGEIAQYQAHHAIGSMPRLAFDLLLCTGQRRSDVIRMGNDHINDGTITIRQQKTGVVAEIKISEELRRSIDATPTGIGTFIVTSYGKPFTAAGFGNWFREQCDKAGLPKGCSAHGLRKAAAVRYAEAGYTPHELMATMGWKTLQEPTRYTAAVDRKRLARNAASKSEKRTG